MMSTPSTKRTTATVIAFLLLSLLVAPGIVFAQDSASASNAPPLTSEQIRSAMMGSRQSVRDCVFNRQADLPSQLDMVVEFVISNSGNVQSATMYQSNTTNEEVDSCVVNTVSAIEFPEPSGGQPFAVRYRFFFVTGS